MATSKLTPVVADGLVDAVKRGVPVTTALRAGGFSATMWQQWQMVADSGVAVWPSLGMPMAPGTFDLVVDTVERLRRAVQEAEQVLVSRIYSTAMTANAKTGVPEWRAAAWLLNNAPAYRADYHEHKEIALSGGVTVSVEGRAARALSTEQLRAIASGQAKLLPARGQVIEGNACVLEADCVSPEAVDGPGDS